LGSKPGSDKIAISALASDEIIAVIVLVLLCIIAAGFDYNTQ
jgi:hypothetical protein